MNPQHQETRVGRRRYGQIDKITSAKKVILVYTFSYLVPIVSRFLTRSRKKSILSLLSTLDALVDRTIRSFGFDASNRAPYWNDQNEISTSLASRRVSMPSYYSI